MKHTCADTQEEEEEEIWETHGSGTFLWFRVKLVFKSELIEKHGTGFTCVKLLFKCKVKNIFLLFHLSCSHANFVLTKV